MRIGNELKDKVHKVVAENLDLYLYMAQDLERAEMKMEAEYNKLLENATEHIKETKDDEIRRLRQQMAKYRKDEDSDSDSVKIQRELNFQNNAWRQELEQAQHAQEKIMAARSNDSGLLQCYVGFQESPVVEDKYTDGQA